MGTEKPNVPVFISKDYSCKIDYKHRDGCQGGYKAGRGGYGFLLNCKIHLYYTFFLSYKVKTEGYCCGKVNETFHRCNNYLHLLVSALLTIKVFRMTANLMFIFF